MRLDSRIKIQFAVFATIAITACAVVLLRYIDAPAMFFGIGRYTVTLELTQAGGLYYRGNVTYRGTQVGRVEAVHLTATGAAAVLSLNSDVKIPSHLRAEVHSQSAAGEQYIELSPRDGSAPPLKDGDVIPVTDTSVPPDIDALLSATNRGLLAIPQDNLKTVINESYTAVGNLDPQLGRLVRGSTQLAIDVRQNLGSLTTLIDKSGAVVDSQAETSDSIRAWAAHLALITGQLQNHDADVAGVLQKGGPALDQGRQLITRLRPTLPLVLANLVSLGDLAITYHPALEQLLVLVPQGVANMQGTLVANHNTKQGYRGLFLDFKLNLNLPPVCNTGFLPPQQQRAASKEDYPVRPAGDLYCRVPQDAAFNVRGARNYPCQTVPGKRAPTAKLCRSDKQYVPLNDGFNWKGDPNATLSGQSVPDLPTAQTAPSTRALPPVAAAQYDPATGTYVGPDGRLYRQSDLAPTAQEKKTWQSMLIPPSAH